MAALSAQPVLSRFVNDERGNLFQLFAVALIPLIGAVGGAVDYSQAVAQRQVSITALDSATLATARAISYNEIDPDDATAYLGNLFSEMIVANGKSVANFDAPVVDYDPNNGEVSAEVTSHVKAAFMKILGVETLDISAASSAVFSRQRVDLAIVVDVTGSMEGSKLTALQDAAETLVKQLLDDDETTDDGIRIALVPYSEGVKAGDYWDDMYDLMTSSEKSTLNSYGINGTNTSSRCFTERKDGVIGDYGPSSKVYGTSKEANCPSVSMVPMTQNRQTLLDAIDDLSASGMTAGHVGLQWGWNMVSPEWSSFWPASSAPAAYDDDEVKKVIVMMTDGEFNTYYDNGAGEDDWAYSTGYWRWSYYSGYYWVDTTRNWPVQEENAGDGGDVEESDRRAEEWCDDIRDAEIHHYTVAFDAPSSAEDLMEDCATDASYFFDAEDDDDLIDAFRAIGANIRQLHLSS